MVEKIKPGSERTEATQNSFPEPRAFFQIGERGSLQEIKYFDEKAIIALTQKATKIANRPRPRRFKHTGRLPSSREMTDSKNKLTERINRLGTEIRTCLLQSNPDNPLRITITEEASFKITGGDRLPQEETAWRRFLIQKKVTEFWGREWMPLARELFLARTGLSQKDVVEILSSKDFQKFEQDSGFIKFLQIMTDYIETLSTRKKTNLTAGGEI